MSVIQIKVLTGPEAGTVVEGATRITIGSASYCNLRLSGKGVLAVHAEVNATPQGLQLRSFSRTGTLVNGAPITEHYVSPDEQPELGDGTRILVQMVQAAASVPRRSKAEATAPPSPRSPRPAPSAAAASVPPPNAFLATLWRYRALGVLYLVGLIAAAAFLVEDTGLIAQYQAAGKAFTVESARSGVAPTEVKERWAAVERAYSLERAGRRDDAMTEYLRVMAVEMAAPPAATAEPAKSAAWKFAAKRLAALRSGRRARL